MRLRLSDCMQSRCNEDAYHFPADPEGGDSPSDTWKYLSSMTIGAKEEQENAEYPDRLSFEEVPWQGS